MVGLCLDFTWIEREDKKAPKTLKTYINRHLQPTTTTKHPFTTHRLYHTKKLLKLCFGVQNGVQKWSAIFTPIL